MYNSYKILRLKIVIKVKGASYIIINLGGVIGKSRELLCQLINYMANQFKEPLKGDFNQFYSF
jgi:hypothetical protein